jgi:CBS domain containing-hemolysin-like protein
MIAEITTLQYVLWLALLALCVALSAFFSGMETGLYVLNKIRLDLRAEANWKPARTIQRLIRNPGNTLSTLLIGNSVVNYGATFAVSAMYVLSGAGELSELYTLATVAPLLFVVGESIPKNIFQRLAETLTYRLAWLLAAVSFLLNAIGLVPLVHGFSRLLLRILRRGRSGDIQPLARERLLSVVAESQASGVLTHTQSVMAQRVMNIAGVRLADVMIQMAKVVKAPMAAPAGEIMQMIHEQSHSRLPLLDEHGRVAGILDTYDFLAAGEAALPAELADKPLVLPASMILTDALYRMQRAHAPMAVVEDDDARRHVGIVTIKDIVEQIVGELEVR